MKALSRFLRGFSRDAKGVATIEFGLVLPIVIVVIFGAIECVRFLFATTMIERFGEEVAYEVRVACGNVELSSLVSEKVSDRLSPMVSEDSLTVSATSAKSFQLLMSEPSEGTGGQGDAVRLEVKAEVGLFSWLLPSSLTGKRSYVYYFVNEANSYSPL